MRVNTMSEKGKHEIDSSLPTCSRILMFSVPMEITKLNNLNSFLNHERTLKKKKKKKKHTIYIGAE